MPLVPTKILREPWDVDPRLKRLGLDRQKLLQVRAVAVNQAKNATPYHCANAAGTFAYQHGTFALRNLHVGKDWFVDRAGGVEAIANRVRKVRLIYTNVDIACSDDLQPKPRSHKGAGAERLCNANLFGTLPHYSPPANDDFAAFYLMVDEKGAVELTQPVIAGGTFSSYVERIYLSDGKDLDGEPLLLDDDDLIENFDPMVVKK